MSEHEAGRELDALIAERVMGEPYPAPIQDFPWWSSAPVMSPLGQWIASVDPERPGDLARHIWVPLLYSTDIVAAWVVVEHLNELERYPTVQYACAESGEPFWWVTLVNPADVEVRGDSAPHAICLAALAAVSGVRGEGESMSEPSE